MGPECVDLIMPWFLVPGMGGSGLRSPGDWKGAFPWKCFVNTSC